MTNPNSALLELADKGADVDLLRQMVQFMAQRLMDMDVEGRCVEVNQVEDSLPEARRQQQSQAQDDDDRSSGLDEARPEEQRWADGCIRGVLLPLHAV
jgi:hypothetical protein